MDHCQGILKTILIKCITKIVNFPQSMKTECSSDKNTNVTKLLVQFHCEFFFKNMN